MAKWLRQSTASQEIVIGRMVDSTDGDTEETELTIANTDIKIWKTGATTLANKNSGGATHIANGLYSAVLDATDTNTLGPLKVYVHVAGALAWEDSYTVVPAVVYDSLILGTDVLTVDVTQISGSNVSTTSAQLGVNVVQISEDATAADNVELAYDFTAGAVPSEGVVDQGTAQSATSTTLVLRSGASFADDELIGATIVITGGSAGVGQSRLITDYVSSTDTATVETWTTTPTGTITYRIYATAASTGGGGGLDAAGVRAAIGLASADLDTQLGTILADTNELQTDWADGGRLDLLVDAILTDTGTTLDGKIDAIDDFIDTEVTAIKEKTDQLTFGATNTLNANVTHVNEIAVTGDGQEGTEWGPA